MNRRRRDADAYVVQIESGRQQGNLIPHAEGGVRFDAVADVWVRSIHGRRAQDGGRLREAARPPRPARSYQVALGVRVGDVPITIRQVRYLLEAIETKLAWTEERSPELSDADRAERRAALQNVMDKLLGATVAPHLPAHGRYAVDASAIESAARGKHRPTGPKS